MPKNFTVLSGEARSSKVLILKHLLKQKMDFMGWEKSILTVFKHSLVPRMYYFMKGLTEIMKREENKACNPSLHVP